MIGKRGLIISVILVLPLFTLFSSCGDARPDFEEIIASAIEAANEIQTYRMEIENNQLEKGEAERSSGWIEFVAPDRTHVLSGPSGIEKEESIQIGTIIYTRSESSTEWKVRDWGDERFAARNIAVGVLQSFGDLTEVKELRDEKIDGVDCFHYIGSMNMKGRQEEQLASLDESDPHYEQQKLVYESIEYVRDDIEFWIGKEDYLLRQYITYMEISEVRDKGEDTEEVENYSAITTCKFSDFNEPIEIEPPLIEPLEGVHLIARMREVDSGGSDPEHEVMSYEITVSNEGTETANNLRLFVDTKITNEGLQTYEAEADIMPVNLGPDKTVTYHVSWEYNLIELTKEKFLEYLRQNTLRATWTDTEEVQHEEVLITGEE
jgi:hypothetical protein